MPSQKVPITLIKGDKISDQTDYLDVLPENMYAVPKPVMGSAGFMLQHYGLTEYGTGTGADRGGVWNERLQMHFRVSYTQFLKVGVDGSTERFGNIPGMSPVSMPYSFNTQAVIGGGQFWLYDPVKGFRQVIDPDIKTPIDGTWIDGYYFLTDGEYLYHTTIGNEELFDPLSFATAEFSPDPTLGVGKTADDKVVVFNRYSIEYFANNANQNFAFTRVQARALKIGIVATHAKCELKETWYFVGGRKESDIGIHVLGVGTTQQISTRAVDRILSKYAEPELENMSMEAIEVDGMSFIYVHLPNETLLFNETVASSVGIDSAWSVLKRGTGSLPWRGINGVFDPRLGEWVFGDKVDLRLGKLDSKSVDQYGEMSEWVLYTPFMSLEGLSVDSLNIDTMPGHSPSDDATLFVSMTYDGVTYGKEVTAQYGRPGDYNQRYIVNRLGYVRNWVGFKLRGASRAKMAFGRGHIEVG
ncbi:packaged DNA stabilization protein [Pseudomonas phage AH02]|nr:packaged DNA stabilization protein [Pseudomonas phage AH02]